MKIDIEYDGSYPNLCLGELVVTISGEKFVFPNYCMSSGGGVSFNDEWEGHVSCGEWSVSDWPVNFPEEYKDKVEEAINLHVESGCCGGCV